MASRRLLGLTFLLLATLGYAAARSDTFSSGGKSYSPRQYYYFRNYYRSPVHWYFYSRPSSNGRWDKGSYIWDYEQGPGSSFYRYKGNGYFKNGGRYYGYYSYNGGKKYSYSFTYSSGRFSSNPRPYTFTAYPKGGGGGFQDDSSFTQSEP